LLLAGKMGILTNEQQIVLDSMQVALEEMIKFILAEENRYKTAPKG